MSLPGGELNEHETSLLERAEKLLRSAAAQNQEWQSQRDQWLADKANGPRISRQSKG